VACFGKFDAQAVTTTREQLVIDYAIQYKHKQYYPPYFSEEIADIAQKIRLHQFKSFTFTIY